MPEFENVNGALESIPTSRLCSLAESIPWNRFMCFLNVYKLGLWFVYKSDLNWLVELRRECHTQGCQYPTQHSSLPDPCRFKGTVSRDGYFLNIFLEGPKNRNSTFSWTLYGCHNSLFSFCEGNPKWSFCLLLWITDKLWNSFQRLLRFLIASCVSKIWSETSLWAENCSESRLWMYSWKIDQWEQRKAGTESHATDRTIFRNSKCFQRSKQKIHINISFVLDRLKF